MASQQKKKGPSLGTRLMYGAMGAGLYIQGRRLYRLSRGGKKVAAKAGKLSTAGAKAAATVGKTTAKKVGKGVKWKRELSRGVPIGKTRKKSSLYGVSAVASSVKRRRGNTWGRKTTVKAGPAARSAFKKAPRGVARGKVRSPSYAITKTRRR